MLHLVEIDKDNWTILLIPPHSLHCPTFCPHPFLKWPKKLDNIFI